MIHRYKLSSGVVAKYNAKDKTIEGHQPPVEVPEPTVLTSEITSREGMYWWLKFKLAE